MSYADEIHEQVTGIIAREVERQIRVFLQHARGKDWTEHLERTLRENADLRSALQEIRELLPRRLGMTERAQYVLAIVERALRGKA